MHDNTAIVGYLVGNDFSTMKLTLEYIIIIKETEVQAYSSFLALFLSCMQ